MKVAFALRSILKAEGDKNTQMLLIITVLILWYLLSRSTTPENKIVTPEEAELLVEHSLLRKKRWGQLPPMAKWRVGVTNVSHHRDASGNYYRIPVKIWEPWSPPAYMMSQVMMQGLERGFVTWHQTIGLATGREVVDERSILPHWARDMQKQPWLDSFFKGSFGIKR